uniref:ATP synthase F0 subunit 6 n=1 Tax=Brevibora dorsiocellata TaxID=1142237 RepID=UPI0020280461|nr:ATP synthase F0 subunit 6 [Brevibora dorsiocellata]UQJ78781.1 ATP synthase F0 subunit 6 [Brevibora dorsiocellata]
MMTSLFDQFASPKLIGVSLIFIALMVPLLFPNSLPRWTNNRLTTAQTWMTNQFINYQLMPLNINGHKWALLLTSLALYLISMNLLGLLPYTFTPTTQLSANMGFAMPLWLATVIIGMLNQPTSSLGHLLPEGTPTPLIPILVIIETISLFIRPLALGVRLTANLTAGHLLIHLISMAVFVLLTLMPTVALLTATVLIMLTLLEIAVAMIQAYVFILLLSLYLQENI